MRMRIVGIIFIAALAVRAGDGVGDDEAKQALTEFEAAFKTKDIAVKQDAVFDLHDVPNDLVIKRLEKLLKDRKPAVRNVAALAMGGQSHDPMRAGKILMKTFKKDFKTEVVVSSVIDAWKELKWLGYWPRIKPAVKDDRSAIVIRVLDLFGAVKDWRALPLLLEMYRVAMPKRVSWSTGEVTVDTGAAGDADQRAAESAFNARYGRGGSKAKAKAKAKAAAFDERNFSTQLRKCVKAITGEDFDNAMDFEDWYVENYIRVQRKIAIMEGKSPDAAEARAKTELPELKRKVEEERKKIEEELAKQRGK